MKLTSHQLTSIKLTSHQITSIRLTSHQLTSIKLTSHQITSINLTSHQIPSRTSLNIHQLHDMLHPSTYDFTLLSICHLLALLCLHSKRPHCVNVAQCLIRYPCCHRNLNKSNANTHLAVKTVPPLKTTPTCS